MSSLAKRKPVDGSAPVKFLFDMEFDGGGVRGSPDIRAALATAEQEGYRRGFAAAQTEANAKIEKRLAAAFGDAASRLGDLIRRLQALEQRLEAEAVDVAVSVARKLAPALIAREPVAEIEALVIEVFRHVRTAPHVAVRVADDLLEPASARLKEVAEQRGFAGRLVLLPSPDLGPDDCRVEWADGGIERDRAQIERRISEAVARYLARGDAAADEPVTETVR